MIAALIVLILVGWIGFRALSAPSKNPLLATPRRSGPYAAASGRNEHVKKLVAPLPPALITVGEASAVNSIPPSAQILPTPFRQWQHAMSSANAVGAHRSAAGTASNTFASPSSDAFLSPSAGVFGTSPNATPFTRSQNVSPIPHSDGGVKRHLPANEGATGFDAGYRNTSGLHRAGAVNLKYAPNDTPANELSAGLQAGDYAPTGRKIKQPMGTIVMSRTESRATQQLQQARSRELASAPFEGDAYTPFGEDYAASRVPLPSEIAAERFRANATGANYPVPVYIELPRGSTTVAPPSLLARTHTALRTT